MNTKNGRKDEQEASIKNKAYIPSHTQSLLYVFTYVAKQYYNSNSELRNLILSSWTELTEPCIKANQRKENKLLVDQNWNYVAIESMPSSQTNETGISQIHS